MNTLNTHRNHTEHAPEAINTISEHTTEPILQLLGSIDDMNNPEVRELTQKIREAVHTFSRNQLPLPDTITAMLEDLERKIALPQSTLQEIFSSQ